VAPGEAFAQLPYEIGDELSYFVELVVTQIGKVALPQSLPLTVGFRQLDDLPGLGVLAKRLWRRLLSHIGRHDQWFRARSLDAAAPDLEKLPLAERLLPEHLERFVEERDVVAAMNEQRTSSVIEVRSNPNLDVRERLHQVDHATRVDVEPEPSEHAPEQDEISEEMVRILNWLNWHG